jgi:P4 family phage/plasmid primase-like protien
MRNNGTFRALESLQERFNSWTTFQRYRNDKRFVAYDEQKVPYIGDVRFLNKLRKASATDPSTWRTADEVFATIKADTKGTLVGLGFVLNGDGTVCIDLDKCVDEHGNITPEAQQILDRFPNTYAEYSRSGTGIHIWLRTSKPLPEGRTRTNNVEIYQNKRYIAVTMNILPNRPQDMADYTDELHNLYHELFGDPEDYENVQLSEEELRKLVLTARDPSDADEDDDELIARFRRNPDNDTVWRGDKLPHHPSQSEADLSLAIRLLWYTNGDVNRTYRLYWRSHRVLRDKLRDRPELVTRAINKAHQLYLKSKAELEERKQRALSINPEEWNITQPYPCSYSLDSHEYGASVCIAALGKEIMYISEREHWAVYNQETGLWETNKAYSKALLFQKVKQVLVEHYFHLSQQDDYIAQKLNKLIKSIESGETIKKVIERMEMRTETHKSETIFNIKPKLIPLLNGVYDLDIEPDCVDPDSLRRKFRPYRPNDYITHAIQANYDPEAVGDCWTHALEQWCWDPDTDAPDTELIEYLWYAIGYTFTGFINAQAMFVIIGPGGNGKSTFVSAIAEIMANHATTMMQNLFTVDKYSAEPARQLEPLRNKRMVVHPELPAEAQLDCEKIKRIVSFEDLQGRQLYHEHSKIPPTWKIWCTTNEMGEIQDHAAWRRIRIIPFRKVFVPNIKTLLPVGEPDPDLRDKLLEQRDYLATRACHYAALWLHNNKRLPRCTTVEQHTQQIHRMSDPFEDWFNTQVEIEPDNTIPNDWVYNHYCEFVKNLGQTPHTIKKWAQRMAQKQVPIAQRTFNGKRTRCRVGIKLLPLEN